jgi:hypothetical protein
MTIDYVTRLLRENSPLIVTLDLSKRNCGDSQTHGILLAEA